jgi:outer membrane receptor protein involved in Fe transport
VQIKSITSYLHDETHGLNYDTSQISNANGGLPIIASLPIFPTPGPFDSYNNRRGYTQEFRFSSLGPVKPVSWVAGLYWSHIQGHSYYDNLENLDTQSGALYGINTVQRYGVGALPNGSVATRNQDLIDKELAGFGEVNWYVTDKLKLTGGVRVSQVEFTYDQQFYGALNNFLVPTAANGGLTAGSQKETPVTPKGGVEYDFTPNDLVYFTAAKGFRPGGVNSPLSPAICVGLAQQGLTAADVPTTYKSDSVWSYELGAKLRLLDNRLQVNTSAFRIDWSDVQVSIPTTGCGQTYVTNAGAAVSQGFDLQTQALVLPGLTFDAAVGYNDAHYTADAFGPTPKIAGVSPTKVVNKGDSLPVPVWTASLGVRYDFEVLAHNFYARGDYQFTGPYNRGFGAGVNGFAPDVLRAGATRLVNARFGVVMGALDANLFVNNLFDSRDLLSLAGGRTGCSAATGGACTTFSNNNPLFSGTTFAPRTVGVQLAYRY